MRKAILVLTIVGAAAAMLLQAGPGVADEYCARTGITVGEEPWLAHEECVDCPTEECPPIPDLPDQDDDSPVFVEISHRA